MVKRKEQSRPKPDGRRRTAEDYVIDIFAYAFMAAMALTTLVPFLNVVAKAFSAEWAITTNQVWILPVDFQLGTMRYVITSDRFLNSTFISVVVTLGGTALTLLLIGITAYPLSKRKLKGAKPVLLLYVFTMLFSGGMIPNYLLMKHLGLINNLLSVILPGSISVFNMLIVKNYYESLPQSLEESAKLDGASDIVLLFRIIMPLSLPAFATVGLFTAVGHWNDFFGPLLYLNRLELQPLALFLMNIVAEGNDAVQAGMSVEELANVSSESVRSAAIIASTLPILLVYPFLQRYFIKGLMIGSVKG